MGLGIVVGAAELLPGGFDRLLEGRERVLAEEQLDPLERAATFFKP
jgi:hypothetical protein